MDDFALVINRATYKNTNNELNNERGIFIEQNKRGPYAGDLVKFDQLLEITWKPPSQNRPMQVVPLTGEYVDNFEEAVRMINEIPINNMCKFYFKRYLPLSRTQFKLF